MKNLLGLACCIIISKILLNTANVDNLALMLTINYLALTIGYIGSFYFFVLFIHKVI